MIPPLVVLIAGAHESPQQDSAQKWLDLLKGTPNNITVLRHGLRNLGAAKATPEDLLDLPFGVFGAENLPTLAMARLVPDGPGIPIVRDLLRLLSDDELMPGSHSHSAVRNVRAGLHIIHDYLDDGHELVQSADDVDSAYWHAIVHRREPDYGNARYWFRRVGSHPVFLDLARDVSRLMEDSAFRGRLRCDRLLDGSGRWNAMAFVELCQECGTDWDGRAQAAAGIQEIEMRRLLEHGVRSLSTEHH